MFQRAQEGVTVVTWTEPVIASVVGTEVSQLRFGLKVLRSDTEAAESTCAARAQLRLTMISVK